MSAVFAPLQWTVGASGALYGLLACSLVDICQSWQVIQRPWRKFLVVLGEIIALMLIGTLPWVDNWAHIGGFVFGLFAAIVFLPYITFGRADKIRKRFDFLSSSRTRCVLLTFFYFYFSYLYMPAACCALACRFCLSFFCFCSYCFMRFRVQAFVHTASISRYPRRIAIFLVFYLDLQVLRCIVLCMSCLL